MNKKEIKINVVIEYEYEFQLEHIKDLIKRIAGFDGVKKLDIENKEKED